MQNASLKEFLLIGIYSRKGRYKDAQMDQLKLVDKKSGKIFQTLDFSSIPTQVGNVITNIFLNVEVGDYDKDGCPDILIWNRIGKMGEPLYAYYNPQKRFFEFRLSDDERNLK